MEICRACLCTNKNLFQVNETFLSNYNSLTNLRVKLLDGMPKCFCNTCMEAVSFFIKFRDKCISTETTLLKRGLLDINVEVEIKIEKNEDNSDEPCNNGLVDNEVKAEVKEENTIVVIEGDPSIKDSEKDPSLVKAVTITRSTGRRKKNSALLRPTTKTHKKTSDKSSDEYYCGLCDESFIVLDLLNEHLDTHRADKNCSICLKTFENWPKLLAHRVTHSAKKYCHLCPKRFYSLHTLEQHYLTVHYEEKIVEMRCLHCPKKFTCAQKFSIHADTHNIECHKCTEIFANRHLLNTHLRTHDPKKRYDCDLCEYTAVYASVLAYHKKRKHKNFSCKICDRKFADSARLKDHICKDKSKLCPICGKRIFESFTRHLSSHTDTKPFKCERCPASYKRRISLKTHMDRHDNNRTHACDYCGRKFFTYTTLNKHRRVHTGERPYACEKCGKRFTGNSNLKLHMQTHGIMLINKRNKEPDHSVTTASATL